jgi:hypothetical protein
MDEREKMRSLNKEEWKQDGDLKKTRMEIPGLY